MVSIMRRRLSPGDSPDYIGVPAETVERRPEIFREFVERIEPGRTLSLHHSDLPHAPYQYTPTRRYTTETGLPGLSAEQWTEDPAPVREGLRRYLLQLGLVDRLLGELVGRLKRIGLFDRALVVVTADHGVAFQAGDSRRNVDAKNIGEIAGVPLLIKAPGQRRGRIVDSAATTEDILPTIGSLLGARWSAGGRSLENASGSARVTVAGEGGPVTVLARGVHPAARSGRRPNRRAEPVADRRCPVAQLASRDSWGEEEGTRCEACDRDRPS